MRAALRRRTVLPLLLLALPAARAQAGFDASHAAWSQLLKRHVRLRGNTPGAVHASELDYRGLAAERPALKAYLAALSSVPRRSFEAWSREARLAFLINAYNAFTVELILTAYPKLASIKDLGSLLRSPWKQSWIPLLGETRSLDDIEHQLIRPVFREPRVHFALNCASRGCPLLREEAYRGDEPGRLEAQLQEQLQRFLTDRSRQRVEGGQLRVSKLFDWYAEDFAPQPKAWLAAHADWLADDAEARERIRRQALPLQSLDYDWRLNDLSDPSDRPAR